MASAEARRLRRLQWAAQLEVDAVWEPLAREAEAAVLRHARVGADGVPRLDAAGAALALATLGNTAGGMTSWWCGRVLPKWQRLEHLPHKDKVERWGSPVLLLAWAPLIGDAQTW